MALEDFVSKPQRVGEKQKFQVPEICPSCGKEGKHLRNHEYRCTTSRRKCDVLTWYHTEYKINNASV